jgi:hypothetical protein
MISLGKIMTADVQRSVLRVIAKTDRHHMGQAIGAKRRQATQELALQVVDFGRGETLIIGSQSQSEFSTRLYFCWKYT